LFGNVSVIYNTVM